MQTFSVKLLVSKILKTKNCVPFEVRYSNSTVNVYMKEEGKYQESIQSSTTPDPRHHMICIK